MLAYLAYTRGTRPTGRIIASALGFDHFGIRTPDWTPEVLVRWGSRRWMGVPFLVLNRASAIRRASDKVETLSTLEEASIPHVPFFLSWEEALDYSGGRGIILGRTRFGMQGRGISVYDPAQIFGRDYPRAPLGEHEWYSLYLEPTREVRVHVVGSKVIRVQGKYKDFPEIAERNPFVRNYKTGYRFRAPRLELRPSRTTAAIEAVEALGLDFGAVDLLLFGDQAEAKILEVNSAPSCSPLTARCYADAISELIKLEISSFT